VGKMLMKLTKEDQKGWKIRPWKTDDF